MISGIILHPETAPALPAVGACGKRLREGGRPLSANPAAPNSTTDEKTDIMGIQSFYRGEDIALTARISGEGTDLSEYSVALRLHVWGSPRDLCFATPPRGAGTGASCTPPRGNGTGASCTPPRGAGTGASCTPREDGAVPSARQSVTPYISVRSSDTWALGIPGELTAGLSEGVCTAVTTYTHLPTGTVVKLTDTPFRLTDSGACPTAPASRPAPAAAGTVTLTHTLDTARHIGLDGLSAYEVWAAEMGGGTQAEFMEYLREPASEAAGQADESARRAYEAAENASGAAASAVQAAAQALTAAANAAEAAVRVLTAAESAETAAGNAAAAAANAEEAAASALAARDRLSADLAAKADESALHALSETVALKADEADLALKADKTDLTAKADKTELTALSETVALKADEADLARLAPLDAAGKYIDPARLDPLRPSVSGLSFASLDGGAEWDGPAVRLGAFTVELLAELRDANSASLAFLQLNDWMQITYRSISCLLGFYYMKTDLSDGRAQRLGGTVSPGLNHVVVTWSSGDPTLRCRVNGTLRGEAEAPELEPVIDRIWLSPPGFSSPRPVHLARVFDYAADDDAAARLWNFGDPASYRLPPPSASDPVPGRCVAEYVPAGLAGGLWRDSSGNGRDLVMRGDWRLAHSPARFPDPLTGSGPPDTLPSFAGQRYADLSAGAVWIAAGTDSADKWKQLL